MINHIKKISFDAVLFIDICILEFLLLNYLKDEPKNVEGVLHAKTEVVLEKVENEYVCAYATFIRDVKIHINCEHPIESLTYKYFKLFIGNCKASVNSDLDFLLFLLYVRQESERFFKVFAESQRTLLNIRLTLLLTLYKTCCRESDDIKKFHDKYNIKYQGLIKTIIEITDDASMVQRRVCEEVSTAGVTSRDLSSGNEQEDIDEKMSSMSVSSKDLDYGNDLTVENYDRIFAERITLSEVRKVQVLTDRFNMDRNSSLVILRITNKILSVVDFECVFDVWFENRKQKQDWTDNFIRWCLNRDQKLDADMISCCTNYQKFDEGYLIYSEIKNKDEQCMIRACSLCLNAFKISEDSVWLKRIYGIQQQAFTENIPNAWRNMVILIFENLRLLNLSGVKEMIIHIVEYFDRLHFEKDENLIKCMLKGFLTTISQRREKNICEICHKYAIFIYSRWRLKKGTGFMFFKKRSIQYDDIYSYILGVCDEYNDCDKFHDVCRDILKSNDKIGDNMLLRLEKYHLKCRCGKYTSCLHVAERQQCRMFLKHCMNEFKD